MATPAHFEGSDFTFKCFGRVFNGCVPAPGSRSAYPSAASPGAGANICEIYKRFANRNAFHYDSRLAVALTATPAPRAVTSFHSGKKRERAYSQDKKKRRCGAH